MLQGPQKFFEILKGRRMLLAFFYDGVTTDLSVDLCCINSLGIDDRCVVFTPDKLRIFKILKLSNFNGLCIKTINRHRLHVLYTVIR